MISKKTNELVSIIVPIYNSEKHIKKCIESILKQTYEYIELILVDDGSIDNSTKIIDDYKQKYERIKVLHKKNGGVSSARNEGIKLSTGKYIMFIDSDDYIEKNYVQIMITIAEQNSIEFLISDHIIDDDKGEHRCRISENIDQIEDITYPKFLDEYFLNYNMCTSCKTLFSKNMIEDNSIFFDKNMSYGEDMLFAFKAYISSKKSYYVNNAGYHYVMNSESVSHSKDVYKCNKYMDDNLKMYKFYLNKIVNEKTKKYAIARCLLNYLNAIDELININYSVKIMDIKKSYNKYIYYFSMIDFTNIKFVKLFNKIRILLLKDNHICLFILISKIKKMIKQLLRRC